jgi:broad specificity phosphatase PhoE
LLHVRTLFFGDVLMLAICSLATKDSHPEWKATAARKGDPPLSTLGHQQARETGAFLDSFFAREGLTGDDITWLSSPFLRTIQSSNDMINSFRKVDMDAVLILPENSVWELDGHDGKLHACLPPIEERKMYFPRVNVKHESLFTPSLPEPRSEFLARCDRAIAALNRCFHFRPRSAIVIVSHAAACVGLARAAANATLQDVNPAGPCGIYRLTRTSETSLWDLDHYSSANGMNAYSKHLSDVGTTTVPWNHFGDKKLNKGYTGPPMENEEL